MNEIELKKIFDFNGDEANHKDLKEIFASFIKSSKNDSKFFIKLLDYYSKCRPHHQNFSKELVECVYFCFPEQITEIKQYIKEYPDILKFIMFPEEFPTNEIEEQQNEMFLLLQKDDIDGFISFISNNPTIDITKEQELEDDGYYFYLFYSYSISLIDFCCFFCSLKCFKYLLLNKCEITFQTLERAIAGGNQEIIAVIQQNGHGEFEYFLEASVHYHRYELTSWLNENYECILVSLPLCIWYHNIHAFFYFLEHGQSLGNR